MNRHLAPCLLAFTAGLLSPSAVADCIDGMRKESPAEAAYFQKVQGALKEALPPPPANWTMKPGSDRTLGGLCKGTAEGGFMVEVTARYTYQPPKAESDRLYAEYRKVQAEIDALETLPPDSARERDAIMAKYSEKTREARQADKDGNKDLAKALWAERDAIDKQARELRNRHLESVKPKVEELRARQKTLNYRSQDVEVRIAANEPYPRIPDPRIGAQIVAGSVPPPKSHGMKVHGVRAVFEGPAEKREELIAALDKSKLQRIVQ